MINVENLVKWFGPTLAVDDLTFSIPKGQIVGFLGPNGAGKSTTLRVLTGFIPPTAGRATIAGHDVISASHSARAQIGYLPENTPLYPEMRVDEYLDFRGKLFGMDRPKRKDRIGVVTERCGLASIRRRIIGHLSKGNRQRVGLAQALLHDPPVLILDEPTAGLDPTQIVQIRHLLTELRDDHAILLSSHILTEIERTVDRVMILRLGKLIAEGTTDELCSRAEGGSRIIIDIKANPSAVADELRKLEGVRNVETSTRDGWCSALVVARDSQDPRQPILGAISARGWAVRELRRRNANLEDYYLQVFADLDTQADRRSA